MKTKSLPGRKTPLLWQVLTLSCLALPVLAQQQVPPGYSYPPPPGYGQAPAYPSQAPAYGYSQQEAGQRGYPQQGYSQPHYSQPQTEYVSPMEFLPTFGRKFGDMFRRLFYGDAAPQGYSNAHPYSHSQPGRSLDSAPPSYQSHYGQGQYRQPGYPPSSGYPQPRYQQPPQQGQVPQYQTPPPQQRLPSTSTPAPQQGRMSSSPPPRISVKPKTSQSSPPPKYTPPTITKKTTPTVQDTPPAPTRKDTASKDTKTEYYPLPGAQPKKEDPAPSSATKPKTSGSSSTAGAGNSGSFLKGKRTGKEGRVISPYPPYQELDVTGLGSGSLALDPTTQKVFEVP